MTQGNNNHMLAEFTDYDIDLVRTIVTELPAKERKVIHLRYCEGYRIDEIAKRMRCSRRESSAKLEGAHLTVKAGCLSDPKFSLSA